MTARIDIPRESVAEFCRRHRIRRLALFGSVLRDDFRLDSDVDVLVEFNRPANIGLLALAAMELELSEILGRKVDLRTPAELSRYFRDEVVESAEVLYAAWRTRFGSATCLTRRERRLHSYRDASGATSTQIANCSSPSRWISVSLEKLPAE